MFEEELCFNTATAFSSPTYGKQEENPEITPSSVNSQDPVEGKSSTAPEEQERDSTSETDEEFQSFFSHVVETSKQILRMIRNLKQAVLTQSEQGSVISYARQTASSTLVLMQIVKNYLNQTIDGSITVEERLLLESCKKLRNSVLKFLESAKSSALNPYDFYSKEQLHLSSNEVVTSLKTFISSAESMEPEEDDEEEDEGEAIIEHIKLTTFSIKEIAESMQKEDKNLFAKANKDFILAIGKLISVSQDYELNLEEKLKESTVQLVYCAKVAFGNLQDPVLCNQWNHAQKSVSEILKAFLFHSMNQVSKGFKKSSYEGLIADVNLTEKQSIQSEVVVPLLKYLLEKCPALQEQMKDEQFQSDLVSEISQRVQNWIDSHASQKEPTVSISDNEDEMKILQQIALMKTDKEWYRPRGLTNIKNAVAFEDQTSTFDEMNDKDVSSIDAELENVSNEIEESCSLLVTECKSVLKQNNVEEIDINEVKRLSDTLLQKIKKSLTLSRFWLYNENSTSVSTPSISRNRRKSIKQDKKERTRIMVDGMITVGLKSLGQAKKTEDERDNISSNPWHGNIRKLEILKEQLPDQIGSDIETIQMMCLYLVNSISSLAKEKDRKNLSNLFQLLASGKILSLHLNSLHEKFEKWYYVNQTESSLRKDSQASLRNAFRTPDVDVDIWDEIKSNPIQEKEIKGGTLNQIMAHLTYTMDSNFLSTFITTYQSFTTPSMVLLKLQQRYKGPNYPFDEKELLRVRLRVCVVLNYWISKQSLEFDDELIKNLSQFINQIKRDQVKELAELGNRLSSELLKRTTESQKSKTMVEIRQTQLPKKGVSPVVVFMEFSELDVAKQLTLIEFQTFAKIKPSELLNQAWSKPSQSYMSPNVTELISRANRISFFVASVILWHEKLSDRARVIEKFVRIAEHLLNVSNFNTLISFIAGLNVSAISRLKHTWNGVNSQTRESITKFQTLFDPSNSFKNYRIALKTATSKGPVMPYIGVPLSDLTFSEDGNPDNIQQTINFTKRELISKVIMGIQLNQQPSYSYQEREPLFSFLKNLPASDEKELYELSLHREPRGCSLQDVSQLINTLL